MPLSGAVRRPLKRKFMPYPKSCQRKLGSLSLVSEELKPREPVPHQRTLSGRLELQPFLDKCREVRRACFPDRGFIRLKVAGYYATWDPPERYSLVAFDTNGHGYHQSGMQTIARQKSGGCYKRPPKSLCEPGHVGICWGYRGQDGYSFFASLASDAAADALRELEEMHGERPETIEVRVQMVWLRPDDAHWKRAFMSWGNAID